MQQKHTPKFIEMNYLKNNCHIPDMVQVTYRNKWWVVPGFRASQTSRFMTMLKDTEEMTTLHN